MIHEIRLSIETTDDPAAVVYRARCPCGWKGTSAPISGHDPEAYVEALLGLRSEHTAYVEAQET